MNWFDLNKTIQIKNHLKSLLQSDGSSLSSEEKLPEEPEEQEDKRSSIVKDREGQDELFFQLIDKVCQPGQSIRIQNGRIINQSQDASSTIDHVQGVDILLIDKDIFVLYTLMRSYVKYLIKFFLVHIGDNSKAKKSIPIDQSQKFFQMVDMFPDLISSLKLQELVSIFGSAEVDNYQS